MAGTNRPLANRILLGLVIGAAAGAATLALSAVLPAFRLPFADEPRPLIEYAQAFSTAVLDPLGQIFLRLLFFVVIPLVFASLASGVAQLGRLDRLGPLAGRTFSLFFLNMTIGVGLGLLMMNVVQPGNFLGGDAQTRLMAEFGGAAQRHVQTQAAQPEIGFMTLVDMFMPRNLFGAFVGNNRGALGEVLPLILFAILVGAAGTLLADPKRQKLLEGLELVTQLMTGIVNFALRLAPYAVPAMIYSVVVKIGLGIILSLGVFVIGCAGVMLLHMFGTMSVFLKLWSRRSPAQFFRDIKAVLITAFSTSSSNATLPASIECARDTLKVRPSTAGFVLPLGATMNMSGTALYEGCVVLFIAQVLGVELTFVQQITLLIFSVLSAVAVARPTSQRALLAVPGIGPVKAQRFGPDLLRIVAEAG